MSKLREEESCVNFIITSFDRIFFSLTLFADIIYTDFLWACELTHIFRPNRKVIPDTLTVILSNTGARYTSEFSTFQLFAFTNGIYERADAQCAHFYSRMNI